MTRGWRCLVGIVLALGVLAQVVPVSAQVLENDKVQKLKEGNCSKIIAPDVIEVDGIGTVKLLGIHPPKSTEFGYDKAMAATQKFVENQTVKVEICPVKTKNWARQLRAVVYYTENNNWYNLNTKMLRAGLASVVVEPKCHLNTEAWQGFVREAMQDKHGIFHEGKQIPVVFRQAPTPALVARPAPKSGPATFPYRNYKISPVDDVPVRYVGSIETRRFHRLTCIAAPKESDRVYFPTRLQALKESFQPCLICRP